MIVVCQKCSTRFQLEEARIPAKGARVRCSRCKHAFLVAPPVADEATIHRIAERAAAGARPEAGRHGESDEDDWQFNLDPPGAGEAPSGARTAGAPPPAEITDSEPTESESVESFFEFDGLADPEAPPAPRAAPPPKPIEPEQEVDFQDLGNPEGWDFGVGVPAAGPAAAPKKAPKKKSEARSPAHPAAEARPQKVSAEPAPPQAPRRAAPRTAALVGALAWTASLVLLGLGLRGALAPPAPGLERGVASIGPLELGELRVRHLENFHAGPVVVVAGALRNPGSAPARAGAALRLRVLDARGSELPGEAAWFGPALPDRELRELDPERLAGALASAAPSLAARSLGPDESLDVQALLSALPPQAAGFRVEAAGVPAPAERGDAGAPAATPAPDGAPGATGDLETAPSGGGAEG